MNFSVRKNLTFSIEMAYFTAGSIEEFDFIVALHVGCYYMQLLSPLSKALQLEETDFVMAMEDVANLLALFKSKSL